MVFTSILKTNVSIRVLQRDRTNRVYINIRRGLLDWLTGYTFTE
jgi:hypothetical protein